ncbi:MAG TPA: hypothetical protein VMX75_09520, partial [Spirochaetia bacterium]|nr:hypothetical protein [Spirochaetia bacterium]
MDRLERIKKRVKDNQIYYSAFNPRSEYLHDIEEAGEDIQWMIYEIERLKSVSSGPTRVPQDLHIHTTFSTGDSSVLPEQTVELIAGFRHAEILGVSDHLDYLTEDVFPRYKKLLRRHRLHIGTEVNGSEWVGRALEVDVDYYIYHCRDIPEDYRGAEALLSANKPVIIAHPLVFDTDPDKLPQECLIEINNRYVWRY